jgi:CheY-like chemotaxis protein
MFIKIMKIWRFGKFYYMNERYKNLKVIIADDYKYIVTTNTSMLLMFGFSHKNIRTAKSGEEALALAKEEMPDLLLSDYNFGTQNRNTMTGADLIRAMRALPDGHRFKAIILSANAYLDEVKRDLRTTLVDKIFTKPTEIVDIQVVIDKLFGDLPTMTLDLPRRNEPR